MPQIGYQDGSDRSEWYAVERLLRKYAVLYRIKIFVYVCLSLSLSLARVRVIYNNALDNLNFAIVHIV